MRGAIQALGGTEHLPISCNCTSDMMFETPLLVPLKFSCVTVRVLPVCSLAVLFLSSVPCAWVVRPHTLSRCAICSLQFAVCSLQLHINVTDEGRCLSDLELGRSDNDRARLEESRRIISWYDRRRARMGGFKDSRIQEYNGA